MMSSKNTTVCATSPALKPRSATPASIAFVLPHRPKLQMYPNTNPYVPWNSLNRLTSPVTVLARSSSRTKARRTMPRWTTTTARHPSTSSVRTTPPAVSTRTKSIYTDNSSRRQREFSSRGFARISREASCTCTLSLARATTLRAVCRRSSPRLKSCVRSWD